MSKRLPRTLDPWRMVSARSSWQGTLPLVEMTRLSDMLAGESGQVDYTLDFDRNDQGVAYVGVQLRAALVLQCQRTLKPFTLPVSIDVNLGLIVDDRDDVALPPDYEPLLVENNRIHPLDVIEDELVLAIPLIPVSPESQQVAESLGIKMEDDQPSHDEQEHNPFAVLRELKEK